MIKIQTKLLAFALIISAISACKNNGGKLTVLEEKAEVSIQTSADCRESTIFPLENEAALKVSIQAYAAGAVKKVKFKTNASPKKANSRISKIELSITENCAVKSDKNPPPVKLHQKITLENTKTKQLYFFEVDTLINNQVLSPNRIAVKKSDYQSYIQPLTERNFMKAKAFFSKKK